MCGVVKNFAGPSCTSSSTLLQHFSSFYKLIGLPFYFFPHLLNVFLNLHTRPKLQVNQDSKKDKQIKNTEKRKPSCKEINRQKRKAKCLRENKGQ